MRDKNRQTGASLASNAVKVALSGLLVLTLFPAVSIAEDAEDVTLEETAVEVVDGWESNDCSNEVDTTPEDSELAGGNDDLMSAGDYETDDVSEDNQLEESYVESVEESNVLEVQPDDFSGSVRAPLAAAADGLIASGEWGECSWSLDGEGQLHIWPTNGKHGKLASILGSISNIPWYEYRSKVISVTLDQGVVLPEYCTSMFSGCSKLTSLNASGWDTSSVTDMCSMFYGCSSLVSLDVSGWDTSSVEVASNMFSGCSKLTSLDVSGWDTSLIWGMDSMFYGCSSLVSLDVSGWDTSSVIDMTGMFHDCSKLTSLDPSGWDTSSVHDMSFMFYGCSKLTSLDVSGWKTSSVEFMPYMFYGCSKLSSLDLSGWDTSSVISMYRMLSGCTGIKRIRVGVSFAIKSAEMIPPAPSTSGWWSMTDQCWYTVDKIVTSRSGIADTYISSGEGKQNIAKASVTGVTNKTYNGKAQMQSPVVKLGGRTLTKGTDYTVSYKNNIKAGKATIIITGKGNYTGTVKKTFAIAKAANPLKASGKTVTVASAKKVKRTVAKAKVVTTSNAQGKVTFKKASGSSRLSISSAGKVTVKKGTKKGTYSMKVKVTAAGNASYKAGSKTVTIKVKVK